MPSAPGGGGDLGESVLSAASAVLPRRERSRDSAVLDFWFVGLCLDRAGDKASCAMLGLGACPGRAPALCSFVVLAREVRA